MADTTTFPLSHILTDLNPKDYSASHLCLFLITAIAHTYGWERESSKREKDFAEGERPRKRSRSRLHCETRGWERRFGVFWRLAAILPPFSSLTLLLLLKHHSHPSPSSSFSSPIFPKSEKNEFVREEILLQKKKKDAFSHIDGVPCWIKQHHEH